MTIIGNSKTGAMLEEGALVEYRGQNTKLYGVRGHVLKVYGTDLEKQTAEIVDEFGYYYVLQTSALVRIAKPA